MIANLLHNPIAFAPLLIVLGYMLGKWIHRRHVQHEMAKLLTILMGRTGSPEAFVENMVRNGCKAMKLSRGRTLLTTPSGKGKILVTTEFIAINPTEEDFEL